MDSRTKRNVLIIGGVAVGINIIEALIVPNVVEQKFGKDWKFKFPTARVFASSLAILIVTSMIGGYISDRVIAKINTPANTDNTQLAQADNDEVDDNIKDAQTQQAGI